MASLSRRANRRETPSPKWFIERVRDNRFLIARAVNNDRQQERAFDRHQVRALDRESPFEPKIALEPLLRVLGDQRNEERAVVDLAPDLLIPDVTAAQLALVEPDLDTGRAQRLANPLGSLRILRGVAQKYRVRQLSHRWIAP